MKKLGLLFLVGYSASAGVAHAATYYVSKTGSNNNSCAQAQSTSAPKGTIGAGLGCLVAGDTLLVRAGTYDEKIDNNVPSGTSWTNKVRIAAYPGETVWLAPSSGEGALALTGIQQYIEFDGINMRGPASGAVVFFGGTSVGGKTHHLRIQNAEIVNGNAPGWIGTVGIDTGSTDNEFINLVVDGLGGPYGFYVSGDRNLIDHCDIHHVDGGGVHIYASAGTPTGNIVRNSRIHDISTYSFFGKTDPRRFGVLITGSSNQVYNNVIYRITGGNPSGNQAIFAYSGSGHKIWNNTITGNDTRGIFVYSGASNVEVKNNISYGDTGGADFLNEGSGTTISNNLFAVDPLFVDPSANNFQLQSNSRAIDAAVSVSVVTTDFAGVARPQGSAPDIGSYEYRAQQAQSSAPAAPTGVRIVSN